MDATKAHLQSWQGCQPLEYYWHGELSTTRIGLRINLLLLWWANIPESVQLKVWEKWNQNRVVEGTKDIIICKAEYFCTAAVLYYTWPRDPQKVVVGSPGDLLKILANGSPDLRPSLCSGSSRRGSQWPPRTTPWSAKRWACCSSTSDGREAAGGWGCGLTFLGLSWVNSCRPWVCCCSTDQWCIGGR